MIGLLALFVGACSEQQAPAPEPKETPSPQGDTAEAQVGASGGALVLADGTRLEIPAGALPAETTIRITKTTAPVDALGPAYLFTPEGTTFASPVTISLPYTATPDMDGTPVVYTAPGGSTEFTALAATEIAGGRLAAQTTHFSVYYVGLNGNGAPAVIASGENYPVGIAVDSTHVYWANDGSQSKPGPAPGFGFIQRVPIAGGLAETISPAQNDPKAVVTAGGWVYWTLGGNESIDGGPGGSGVMGVSTKGGTPTQIAPAAFAIGLCADASNVYFTDVSDHTIGKAPLKSGAASMVASGHDASFVTTDGAFVYFTTKAGAVMKAKVDGGEPTVLASGQADPRGIAVGAGKVFWANRGNGTIMALSLTGTKPSVLATDPGTLNGVATDGANVYWTNMSGGTVSRVPAAGGKVKAIGKSQHQPFHITLDATKVYWTNNGHTPFDGSIMVAAK